MSQPTMALLRHEKRMKAALAELAKSEAMLPELWAENPHELVRSNGLKNYLKCWKFALTASLERKESRGANLREDYPFIDNINWLKRVLLVRNNDHIETKIEKLPLYRWPVKPEKYEIVKLPIELPKVEV